MTRCPVVSLDVVTEGLGRALPIVAFLLAITAVAELSDRAGVFDVIGHWIARHGRHRMWLLWLLVSAFAVTCTIFLSLDTTAVHRDHAWGDRPPALARSGHALCGGPTGRSA